METRGYGYHEFIGTFCSTDMGTKSAKAKFGALKETFTREESHDLDESNAEFLQTFVYLKGR